MRNKKESEVTCDREESKNEILQCLVGYEGLTMFFCLLSSWVELILLNFPSRPEISRSPKLSSPVVGSGLSMQIMLRPSYFYLEIYQSNVSGNTPFLSLETQAIMSCKSGYATGILNPYTEVCWRIKSVERKTLLRDGGGGRVRPLRT